MERLPVAARHAVVSAAGERDVRETRPVGRVARRAREGRLRTLHLRARDTGAGVGTVIDLLPRTKRSSGYQRHILSERECKIAHYHENIARMIRE